MFRSKKYKNNLQKIQTTLGDREVLNIPEALNLLMSLEQPNFKTGPSLEIHFKLNIDPSKSDQLIRSSVVLPHGSGKEVKIAAFVPADMVDEAKKAGAYRVGAEDLIEEIKKDDNIDFDVAIAHPSMMKLLAKIARNLGTKGVMPNPKTGTVGEDITGLITSLKAGKVNFKNDKTGNLHLVCGRLNSDFDAEKLEANVRAVVEAVQKAKPEVIKKKYITGVYLTTSQSPSVKVSIQD